MASHAWERNLIDVLCVCPWLDVVLISDGN